MDVVAGQWELAVIVLANWAALRGGAVTFQEGEVLLACPKCKRPIPYSSEVAEGSGIRFCRDDLCRGADLPVPVMTAISKTALTDAFNACRRLLGGVRAYLLLRGLPIQLQATVLHCTGTNARQLVHFFLSCLPEDVDSKSRQIIAAITDKGKVESLYVREFRELVASAVACAAIFTEDLAPPSPWCCS